MRNTKNAAFTLVELIVVITILAILGTIAFISLQGYSADARNSKRTSDIGNIKSSINLKMVEGVPLMSFIADNVNRVTTGALAWSGNIVSLSLYNAGTPAYTVLGVIQKDFLDPQSDKAYRIGATTLVGWVFQVAATMERDGTDTALVNGTFLGRSTTAYSGTADAGSTIFTLTDSNANRFKFGDMVNLSGGTATPTIVRKVSRDGVTLTLWTSAGTNHTISLALAEIAGLVGDANSTTTSTLNHPVKNTDTDILPY